MKKVIRLTESDLHKIVKNSIKRILKESYNSNEINESALEDWENNTFIPDEIMNKIDRISQKLGNNYPIEQKTITLYDNDGNIYGFGKGFTLSNVKYSYTNDTEKDISNELMKYIRDYRFGITNSYDNISRNYSDDNVHFNDIIYLPSIIYVDELNNYKSKNNDDMFEAKNNKIHNYINESEEEEQYTHFAVNKNNNLIVNGWDYSYQDPEELRRFKKDYFMVDLIDNGFDPKQYKILTRKGCIRQGINPDDQLNNWSNNGEISLAQEQEQNNL